MGATRVLHLCMMVAIRSSRTAFFVVRRVQDKLTYLALREWSSRVSLLGRNKDQQQRLPLARPLPQALQDLVKPPPPPRFDHPRVLLLDLDDAVLDRLREAGFRVAAGTFGAPYTVARAEGMAPVVLNGQLPGDFTEQEVVIVDLAAGPVRDEPSAEFSGSVYEPTWWATLETGTVDPRPAAMAMVRDRLDRILQHGGLFVVFAEPRYAPSVFLGQAQREGFSRGQVLRTDSVPRDNWGLLSALSAWDLAVRHDTGAEIRVLETTGVRQIDLLCRAIRDHLAESMRKNTHREERVDVRYITLHQDSYCPVMENAGQERSHVRIAGVSERGDAGSAAFIGEKRFSGIGSCAYKYAGLGGRWVQKGLKESFLVEKRRKLARFGVSY